MTAMAGLELQDFLQQMRVAYDRGLGPKATVPAPLPSPLWCHRTLTHSALAGSASSLRHMVIDDAVRLGLRHDTGGVFHYVEWEEPARMESNGALIRRPIDPNEPVFPSDWLVARAALVDPNPVNLSSHSLTEGAGLWPDRLWVRPRDHG